MLSKLSRILNKRHDSFGLGTSHSRSTERAAATQKRKGKENMDSLRKTSIATNK
jgi:hypothetical protein